MDVDRPLQDIGIDSLTTVQMRNHLATLMGLTLSVNIAFLHPNLKALSQSLFKGSSVGEHVFGDDDYPAPLVNEQFVETYLNRIYTLNRNT